MAVRPASDPMLTILPAPAFRMPGSTAFTMRTVPKKLVSNWALASARLVSSAAPVSAYPALLTSTSSRPVCDRTWSTQARTDSSERTSSANSRNCSGVARSGRRAVPYTVNPRSVSSCAVARPIPDDAPVINTVCVMTFLPTLRWSRSAAAPRRGTRRGSDSTTPGPSQRAPGVAGSLEGELERLGEQRLFGAEVGVEPAGGQPGRVHDGIDAGRGVAALAEQTGGGVENPLVGPMLVAGRVPHGVVI